MVRKINRIAWAVKEGKSAEHVSALIEKIANKDGLAEKAEALERAITYQYERFKRTPLQRAHDAGRSDLVAVLMQHGASVKPLYDGRASELALCVLHSSDERVRELVRAGADINARVPYSPYHGFASSATEPSASLLHLCLCPMYHPPPANDAPQAPSLMPPRLGLLECSCASATPTSTRRTRRAGLPWDGSFRA